MPESRILCILPLTPHPTINTRIYMLREQGFRVEVMAYERDIFHGRPPNFPVTPLGRIRQGQYLIRMPALAMGKIRSAFYGKPLIVRAGTGDAAEVARHQIGLVVKQGSPDDAAKEVCAITGADRGRRQGNLDSLPPRVYCHTTKAEELALALRRIRRGRPS